MMWRYLKIIFQTENILVSVIVDIVQNVQTQSQERIPRLWVRSHPSQEHMLSVSWSRSRQARQGSPRRSADTSIKTWSWDFPGGPVVKTAIPLQGARVWSFVGKLTVCMLSDQKK